MSSNWAEAPQIEVELPHAGKRVKLSNGWTKAADTAHFTLVDPENDLRLTLLVVAAGGSAEEISKQAFRQIDPTFDSAVAGQGEMPLTEGWEKISQVVYRTIAADSKMIFSVIRTLDGQAFVSLVIGSKAAVSRRMAQVSEILELWKPAGLKKLNLSARKAEQWGTEQNRQLTTFIQSGMEKLLIPGLAIAIVQNGRLVFAEAFGATPSTRFMIGSSTKPLTTLMMARLIEQGLFDWTTPVTDLLPGFSLADPEVTSKLQMRHTVCACTGMPRRDVDFIFRFKGVTPEMRLEEMRSSVRPRVSARPFNTRTT